MTAAGTTPYGQAALDAELAAIRSTGSGGRNGQLNKSSFAVAQLVAGEQIDASARDDLIAAANDTGLDRKEIESSVSSGWKAGLAQPRYPYKDAGGRVLYAKVRHDRPNQKYGYEHQNAAGSWKAGRGDADPVPYRLPDLIAAPGDALIYMAEGEKQADKLAGWGLVATSSKDWKGFEFSGYVRGRTVIILPDNDQEGARIAAAAKEAVERAEGRAVVVELPGLPPKGDIMDWTGDAAELARLVDAAVNVPPETFPVADLALWSRIKASPTPFFMAGFIPQNEVTLVTGAGGGNKSTFGQQLATCSAAGLPMLGVDVAHGQALYITAEDHPDRLHWVQEHICQSLGVDMADLAGKLSLVSIRGRLNNELATFDQDGRLQPREAFELVRSTIAATGARLVVLDNVAHLFAGNENDRAQVTAFINLLYVLCREHGVTILLVAHRNKVGDTYSGSTAWLNAVRSQIVLERPEGLDPDARVLTVGKANYARPDQQIAFRWHDFALILDSDLPADRREELASIVMASADNDTFLTCLRERNRQERPVSENKASRTYAPKEFAAMAEAKGATAPRLEAAMDRLFRLGRIARGVVCNIGRKDREGLIECADPRADLALTRCADVRGVGAPTCADVRPHTPHTSYGTGAALTAAPPASEGWHENPALGRTAGSGDLSRVVFPANPPAGPPSNRSWADASADDPDTVEF